MPSHIPDEKKREIISRWLKGDSRETISSITGLNPIAVTSVVNEWKRELGSAAVEAYMSLGNEIIDKDSSSADILDGIRLMRTLKKLGVESSVYESFLDDFEKSCISAGASPEALANIAKQVFQLAKLDGMTIYQVPAHVENLLNSKNKLQREIEDLWKKKDALGQELLLKEQNYNKIKEAFSELTILKNQLANYNLSMNDISKLAGMMDGVRKFGYDAAKVADLISNLESLEQEKSRMENEIGKMYYSENALKTSIQQIEQTLSGQQKTLESLEKVKRVGFEFKELEQIHDLTNRMAKLHGTDPASVKNMLFHDIEQYYNNEDDFKKRLQETDALLRSKQEELETLQKNYQNKKDVIDLLERLTSKGLNEQTLLKYQIIGEIFKIDLDSLAEDLAKYSGLSDSVKGLEENKAQLEREELLLRHKLAALEDQRLRLVSMINDLMAKPGKET